MLKGWLMPCPVVVEEGKVGVGGLFASNSCPPNAFTCAPDLLGRVPEGLSFVAAIATHRRRLDPRGSYALVNIAATGGITWGMHAPSPGPDGWVVGDQRG